MREEGPLEAHRGGQVGGAERCFDVFLRAVEAIQFPRVRREVGRSKTLVSHDTHQSQRHSDLAFQRPVSERHLEVLLGRGDLAHEALRDDKAVLGLTHQSVHRPFERRFLAVEGHDRVGGLRGQTDVVHITLRSQCVDALDRSLAVEHDFGLHGVEIDGHHVEGLFRVARPPAIHCAIQ